jgi:hypothetical protein
MKPAKHLSTRLDPEDMANRELRRPASGIKRRPERAEIRRGFLWPVIGPFSRHFPDTEVVGRDLPSLGVPWQQNSIAARLVDSQNGKMLGPAGPKRAALCSSGPTSAIRLE